MEEGMLTGGGGLAGIDVADNDNVDVETIVLTVEAESVDVRMEMDEAKVDGSSWLEGEGEQVREDVPHGDG
jgi:hypothetical protein